MPRRQLILSVLLVALLASLATSALAESELSTTLIGSARLWEQKHRADLARTALDKLLAVEPDNARALHLMGMIELRASRIEQAKIALRTLDHKHPGHPLTLALEDAVRVETTDRLSMAKARFLASSSRAEEAAAAMREVFPKGPPAGDLGVEYWHAVGKSPKFRASARAGLEKLAREDPDNPLPRLALANLLATNPDTAGQALQLYAELSQRIDLDRERVRSDWRGLLDELGGRAPATARQSYVQAYPEDAPATEVAALPVKTQRPAVPAAAATILVGTPFKPARRAPDLAALAEQREGESRFAEAAELYDDAAKLDEENRAQWSARAENSRLRATLKDARAALRNGNTFDAESRIQQVLSQHAEHTDALVMLADIRIRQKQFTEAESLYRRALSSSPGNDAAFDSLLTLLEENKRPLDAIALAESHPDRVPALADRIAGWLRDTADAELAASHPSKAMALLERALLHQPAQPWVRYDLARLYIQLGLPELGETVMREGLQASTSAEMRHARALLLSAQNRTTEAIQAIEAIPVAERSDSINRLRMQLEIRQLLQQTATATHRETILLNAEKMAAGNPDLLADIAENRFELGDRETALARLNELNAPSSPELSLRIARLLAEFDNPDVLDQQLKAIATMPGLTPGQQEQLAYLSVTGILQRSKKLAPDEAAAAMQAGLENYPENHTENHRLLAALAEVKSAQGKDKEAEEIYRKLIGDDADNLDARVELAKTLRKLGNLKTAHRELDSALVRAEPGDRDIHRSLARQYLALEDVAMTRKLAERLLATTPEDTGTLLLAARAEAIDHQHHAAASLLQRAERVAGNDAAKLADIADVWFDLGETERGLQLLQQHATQPNPPFALRLHYAELLNRAQQDDALDTQLRTLSGTPGLTSAQAASVRDLSTRLALRKAERLRKLGDLAGAGHILETALAEDPHSIPLRSARAGIHADAGHYALAENLYREILAEQPDNLDARIDLAKLLRFSGDKTGARAELAAVLDQSPLDDTDNQLAVTRQYLALDDPAAARAVVGPLLATHGDNPEVLVQAGRVEKADRQFDEAMQDFQQARTRETPDARDPLTGRTAAEREIAALNERRRYHLEAGMDSEIKPGDPGVSYLSAHEWPVKFSMPLGYDGHLFAHVDRVNLNARQLNLANFDTAALFGKVQAQGAGLTGYSDQFESGTMLGIGFEADDWRADIGATPPEFPVSNIVGGIRKSGELGSFDYRLDFARRPVTSSLVSYAGGRDPATGAVWGGVTRTGLEARLAKDLGPVSLSAQGGRFRLTGENVLDNMETAWRLAADSNVIETEHQRVNLGITYTRWSYDENLRFYSFGHGGYYSPQYYRAIALPISWSGRYGRFSWQLRGSRSFTRSREKTMPFYPTDDALQTSAQSAPLPAGYTAPIYEGGTGHGKGYTLGWSAEFELARNLIVGARLQKDRSDFYAPNFFNLYLRYTFDGKEAQASGALPDNTTVALPPSAIKPYSAY